MEKMNIEIKVLTPKKKSEIAKSRKKIKELMGKFGIKNKDLVEKSYSDLLS